jgi:hypothetical protein
VGHQAIGAYCLIQILTAAAAAVMVVMVITYI